MAWSILALAFPIFLSTKICCAYYLSRNSVHDKNIIRLFASKHHASYGVFIDSYDRLKDPKIKSFQSAFNAEELEDKSIAHISGSDLRKRRVRNLKTVFDTQPEAIKFTPPKLSSKKSPEEVCAILDCLNKLYETKERNALNEEERAGLIDWNKFDVIAASYLNTASYSGSNRTKLINWIKFHVKKRDIKFVNDRFIWTKENLKISTL